MMYFERGGENEVLTDDDMRAGLEEALDKIGKRKKVLAVPPDITRFHSKAGDLTRFAFDYYGEVLTDILPALGTHVPMTPEEMDKMFPGIPHGLFREHKWRSELATLGFVPGSFISEISGGRLDYDWPAQVNTLLTEGGFDLIFSPGQVVPHEVIGMANHSKNIFVGVGGEGGIHKSHFLAAVHGMERIMGRADTPVRRLMNYASEHFGAGLPIVYVHTVVGTNGDGKLAVRGLFIGDDAECFERASELSLQVNFEMLDRELSKVSAATILQWPEWRSYRDAMVLLDYTALDNRIVYTDILLNPLGRRHRTLSDEEARRILDQAVMEDRPVVRGGGEGTGDLFIAVPIHLKAGGVSRGTPGRPWGAALVQPRLPAYRPPGKYFHWPIFWVAVAGGTLVLILVTYTILSRMVIRPVEDMAHAADLAARGDFSARCRAGRSRDEIGRLVASFNYMLDEVWDYHHHLEEKVREARERVEHAERRLVIAQRLAATGKLAAGIAHEINNPMGGMINAALHLKEQAERKGRDERERVYLDLILEGLERIKHTVRNVLVFTPRSLRPADVMLGEILRDVRDLVAHRLEHESKVLRIVVEPPDLVLFCEPGEMRQVFLNLVMNALDAVEPGNGVIEITAGSVEGGDKVFVEVRDNGCGMNPEELNRAFDLFYTTKEAGKGTGLGLPVAHNIVENHGGVLYGESRKGEGTRFRVVLPCRAGGDKKED